VDIAPVVPAALHAGAGVFPEGPAGGEPSVAGGSAGGQLALLPPAAAVKRSADHPLLPLRARQRAGGAAGVPQGAHPG
jgi:hypothetical protein